MCLCQSRTACSATCEQTTAAAAACRKNALLCAQARLLVLAEAVCSPRSGRAGLPAQVAAAHAQSCGPGPQWSPCTSQQARAQVHEKAWWLRCCQHCSSSSPGCWHTKAVPGTALKRQVLKRQVKHAAAAAALPTCSTPPWPVCCTARPPRRQAAAHASRCRCREAVLRCRQPLSWAGASAALRHTLTAHAAHKQSGQIHSNDQPHCCAGQ